MELNDEFVISIGAGKMQLSLITAIKDLGFKVIGIDRDPNAVGKFMCDIFINKSTHDYEGIIKELKKLSDTSFFKSVMVKSSGKPVLTAAKIAETFELEFASVEASELTLNKTMLMKKMKQQGILCPESFNYNNLKFPIIIKPKGSTQGKKDIFLIKNNEELTNIQNELFLKIQDYEIQQYIKGNDCVCFAAIKDKKIKYYTIIDELNCFEMDTEKIFNVRGLGFSIPSMYIGTELENKIFDMSKKIIDALEINSGIIWISYRVNSKNPYLIEIHLDLAGEFLLDKLMKYYTGIDCIKEVVKLYIGSEYFNIHNLNNKFTILFDNELIDFFSEKFDVVDYGKFNKKSNFAIFKNISSNDIKSLLIYNK
jgi:carbamoylphosphate synthase large subunit